MKGREASYHRKPWSVSLTDAEKEAVKSAAPRVRGRWGHPYSAAEYGRAVVLDWSQHVNALPASKEGELPSTTLRKLQEQLAAAQQRVRELEASGRTADLDDGRGPARAKRRGKGAR